MRKLLYPAPRHLRRPVDGALEKLSSIARRRTIPVNHYIFRDGDEAISFAAIVSGVVKLIKTTAEGERHIVGLVYAPEFLGHTFAEQHRFSAAAATEVDMCTFPRTSFNRLLDEVSRDWSGGFSNSRFVNSTSAAIGR